MSIEEFAGAMYVESNQCGIETRLWCAERRAVLDVESNQCGIETSYWLSSQTGSHPLNRTSVGLKPVIEATDEQAALIVESNQCGIETRLTPLATGLSASVES